MTSAAEPFPLPRRLDPDLARVHHYWRSLLRGGAEMPFADDLRLEALPDLEPRFVLMDVFAKPQRFRFGYVGVELAATQPEEVAGTFCDEIELRAPLDFLQSQCSATVEAAAATFLGTGYARLLLPLWGDGRISLLLGAVLPTTS